MRNTDNSPIFLIEYLRDKMISTAMKRGDFQDENVIRLSQTLDAHVVSMQRYIVNSAFETGDQEWVESKYRVL